MLSFQNLQSIIESVQFEHPLMEAYRIQLIPVNEVRSSHILVIEDLILWVEQADPNVKVGMVKQLKPVQKPSQYKETLTVDGITYRVVCNLVLQGPEQQKTFDKTYKSALQTFKKAIKDYEKMAKKQQKEKIKAAKQVLL